MHQVLVLHMLTASGHREQQEEVGTQQVGPIHTGVKPEGWISSENTGSSFGMAAGERGHRKMQKFSPPTSNLQGKVSQD